MIANNLLPISSAMKLICPTVYEQLKTHWDDSLSSYMKYIWQKPISCSSKIASQSRKKFYSALKLFFPSQPINFELAFSEFDRYPILQTGPHCQLYANRTDFNALLLSWMGSQLHQVKYFFVLNSVTRTLQWSRKNGPAWLGLSKSAVNLFNLSSTQMSKLSVCASYPGLSYCLENFDTYLGRSDSNEKDGVRKLLKSLSAVKHEGFISAFTSANHNLLNQLDEKQEVTPLIMNDLFTSTLVAQHLSDSDGIIYKLIFSNSKRIKLKQLTHSLTKEKQHLFLKQSTDYFWGVKDNKIRSLKIDGNFLKEDALDSNSQLKIPLEPESICKALYEGKLIPNIFISFLVLCLMPQIRVLGGTRQIGYLPLIQKLLCSLLDIDLSDEREFLQELLTNDLNSWGTNFIQDGTTPLEWLGCLPKGQELSLLSRHYQNKSLHEITQGLLIFKEHPLWRYMI